MLSESRENIPYKNSVQAPIRQCMRMILFHFFDFLFFFKNFEGVMENTQV
jgi:hypothetical protein